MAAFSKKTNLVHNITYMAIMTAINVVFIVLDRFVPFLILLLILFLPLCSALVSYFCLKRYYIIYAVASIGLCAIFEPFDTIFYIVPAICTGFLIGVLLDMKINPFWMILSSTLVEIALSYAFIPLINLIGNTDIVTSFLTIFRLNDFAFKEELMHLFILFIALTQCSLTHFVLLTEIKKIGIETNTQVASYISQAGVAIGLSIAAGQDFADTIGPTIMLIITATTFVVQLLGPICVKYGVTKAGECGLDITEEDIMKGCYVYQVESSGIRVCDRDYYTVVPMTEKLTTLLETFSKHHNQNFVVKDMDGKFAGIITLQNLQESIQMLEFSQAVMAFDIMEECPATGKSLSAS